MYEEPDWSQMSAPEKMEFPFTILFVGVDNGDRQAPELNINEEFKKIDTALRLTRLDKHIRIRQIFYSKWSEVMEAIMDEKPGVLQMGCHATKRGLELFRTIVTPDMIRQVRDWNEYARANNLPQVRMVATNTCDSDGLAMEFAEFVDFVIGHVDEVDDADAVQFSSLLYKSILDACPLLLAFRMARSASDGYRLYASKNPAQMVFVGKSSHDAERESCELVVFLRSQGLEMIAERFSQSLGMVLVKHLKRLKKEDLDDPELGFLKDWHKRELLQLATEGVIRCASIRQGSDSESEASTRSAGAEPASDEEDLPQGATEAVCLHNGGSSRNLVEDTARLLREFQDFYSSSDEVTDVKQWPAEFICPPVRWSLGMVVLNCFMINALFDGDACVRRWEQLCSQQPREATLVQEMDDLVRRGLVKSHPLLPGVQAKVAKWERKKDVAAVAVIDCVVQQCLVADQDKLDKWVTQVIAGWYESEEGTSAVLKRANAFMEDHILSIQVPVGAAVDTASYGMLMLMSLLASLLLFTHLELRKRGWLQPRQTTLASTAGATSAAGMQSACPHGFVLLISSSGRSFSLTPGDRPPGAVMAVAVQGLRCLARLDRGTWDMLGRVATIDDLCR